MSGVGIMDVDYNTVNNVLRMNVDKLSDDFKSTNEKRYPLSRYWIKFLPIVFDILWRERQFGRIYQLNNYCNHYFSMKTMKSKEAILEAILTNCQDLLLFAEHLSKNPVKNDENK